MYNIAKVAKGEILLFFNDVFDALCKVRLYDQSRYGNIDSIVAGCRCRVIRQKRR